MSKPDMGIVKPRFWDGKGLAGTWEFTIKIDGVRAIWLPENNEWRSRADKPLFNIPDPMLPTMRYDCECFLGSLKDTVRAVRTKHLKPDTPRVALHHMYVLSPLVDRRLRHSVVVDPSAAHIKAQLAEVNRKGFEGLVLRNGDTWVKVKPFDTLDLLVSGFEEGAGKHKGRLGYLVTSKGKVGTGFTDAEREAFWAQRDLLVGKTIEVECMEFTSAGVMRHPRFIRERFDKVATE